MKVFDLTHVIAPAMPVYPGTEQPQLLPASTIEKDGFKETLLHMYSHTGTHMDAPCHLYSDLQSLDKFDADKFVGKAVIIDCSDLLLSNSRLIEMRHIEKYADVANDAEFIIFRTNWDKNWNDASYFKNYPSLSDDVAKYIVDTKKKGVGLDTISVDEISDYDLHIHRILLPNGVVIIENLTSLNSLEDGRIFTLCALPMKYENADGAPIRAVAITE